MINIYKKALLIKNIEKSIKRNERKEEDDSG